MKKVLMISIVILMLVSNLPALTPSVEASVYNYSITDITQTAHDTLVVSIQCLFCSACNPNNPGSPNRGTGCTPFACGYPPASYPSYAPCSHGSPNGRYAAVRLTGSFGAVTQKLICDQSNWPLNTLWSHNFIFSGLNLPSGESITIEADFYCSYCYHWYATPKTFVPQTYTFVYIPFHWEGELGSNTPGSETGFYEIVESQKDLIISTVGCLTDDNTRTIPVEENLIFDPYVVFPDWPLPPRTYWFSATDFAQASEYMDVFGWREMVTFATNHGATGDRYIAITNREMWNANNHDIEGWSNWGATVISEAEDPYTVLHELGHSWGLLDEYQYNPSRNWLGRVIIPGWELEAAEQYNYDNFDAWTSTNHPPNPYPGDDTPGRDASNGWLFDGKRCTMGPAGVPGDHGFCPAHEWDDPNRNEQGAPRAYEGCFSHVDEAIESSIGIASSGLISIVVTFYDNQSMMPTIQEIQGLSLVGKPMQYIGASNYSIQVFSEEGSKIFDSNISLSFTIALQQYLPGWDDNLTTGVVTVHWLAPMFSETTATVVLKNNIDDQIIASQVVTMVSTSETWIEYETTDKAIYDFGETIEVATEINTTLPSMAVLLDVSLLDPNNIVQDYESWVGTIYPTADPIKVYVNVPNSGITGTWTVYAVVLNSTGHFQDSESNFITVGIPADTTPPTTTLTISYPQYTDVAGNTYITSSTSSTLSAADDPGGSGVASTAYRIRNATYDSGWAASAPPIEFYLTGLADGLYFIDYNSTDNAGNIESTQTNSTILDNSGPLIMVENPPAGWALQDGVTFIASASDSSGTHGLNFSIREANGDQGIPVGFEDIPATYDAITGRWNWYFNTLQLPDGYYTVLVNAEDNLGHTSSITVQYSIRNWAILERLPSTPNSKAGRTMPVKFALRVAASVDPTQPFVYNEELTIKIYATDKPSNILQTSTFGETSRDYRIDIPSEKYITNFKTLSTPKTYRVEIWRKDMLIGSFEFKTTK